MVYWFPIILIENVLQLILEALDLLLKLQKSKIENENVAIKHS